MRAFKTHSFGRMLIDRFADANIWWIWPNADGWHGPTVAHSAEQTMELLEDNGYVTLDKGGDTQSPTYRKGR